VRFRVAIESIPSHEFCEETSVQNKQFPDGCCDDASLLLAAFLTDNSIDGARRVSGCIEEDRGDQTSHTWLELNGLIIDITADQELFADRELSGVLVLADSGFHGAFTVDKRQTALADFRVFFKDDPMALAAFQYNFDRILQALPLVGEGL